MSEIAKCPMCGNSQVETLNEYTIPSGAYCCGVWCSSLEKWNQYAAAMELAKAELYALETVQQIDSDEEIYEAFNIRNEARKRVLEVFNEQSN